MFCCTNPKALYQSQGLHVQCHWDHARPGQYSMYYVCTIVIAYGPTIRTQHSELWYCSSCWLKPFPTTQLCWLCLGPKRWWEWGIKGLQCCSPEETEADCWWHWSTEEVFLNCDQVLFFGRAGGAVWHTRWALCCSWVPMQCMLPLYTSGYYVSSLSG